MEDILTPAQRAELAEQYKQIDELVNDRKVHPIVRSVLRLLEDGTGHWVAAIPEETMTKIEALGERARSEGSLIWAMFDLLKLSIVLAKEFKIGVPAVELYAYVNRTILQYDLMSALKQEADPARVAAGQTTTGAAKAPAPAMVNQKAPEGSMRPDQINPGKRRL